MKSKIEVISYTHSLKDITDSFLMKVIHDDEELISYQKKIIEEKSIYLAFYRDSMVGVCFFSDRIHEHRGHTLDFEILTDESSITSGVYEAFLLKMERYCHEMKIDFVATSLLDHEIDHQALIKKYGYSQWFVLKKMIHDGRDLPKHDLEYRHYEDRDFDRYFKGLGEAFAPMRTAMDITPYNVCTSASVTKAQEERDSFLKEKDMMYVFFDQDHYVGAVTIAGAEIDDFYIVDAYQGKGYGRKIIEFSVNLARQMSKQPVFLTVVDWNVKAKKLYQSVGFNMVETKIFYRRINDKHAYK